MFMCRPFRKGFSWISLQFWLAFSTHLNWWDKRRNQEASDCDGYEQSQKTNLREGEIEQTRIKGKVDQSSKKNTWIFQLLSVFGFNIQGVERQKHPGTKGDQELNCSIGNWEDGKAPPNM